MHATQPASGPVSPEISHRSSALVSASRALA